MSKQMSIVKCSPYIIVWFAIVLIAGAAGSYFFNLNFWLAAGIAACALIVNGLIAQWEDRDQ